jgi:threonine/homoserine/homoserine lactone efflux protein
VVLKFVGGAYLIWLGVGLLRTPKEVEIKTVAPARRSLLTSFFAGVVLTLGDVKAIFFYASLFPTFVEMSSLTASDVAVIVLATILAVGGVKLGYAWGAERIVTRLQNRRAQKLAGTAAGCAMVGAGTYLIAKA